MVGGVWLCFSLGFWGTLMVLGICFFLEPLLHCFSVVFLDSMGARGVIEATEFGGFGICFFVFLFFLEGMVLC